MYSILFELISISLYKSINLIAFTDEFILTKRIFPNEKCIKLSAGLEGELGEGVMFS